MASRKTDYFAKPRTGNAPDTKKSHATTRVNAPTYTTVHARVGTDQVQWFRRQFRNTLIPGSHRNPNGHHGVG